MGSDDHFEVETPTKKNSFFDKENIPFLSQLFLLIAITVLCAVAFGYNIKSLKSVKEREYDFETSKIIASALLMTSREPFLFGYPDARDSTALTALVDQLEKRKRVDTDFVTLRQYMNTMFEYGPSQSIPSEFDALSAMEGICLILSHELERQVSNQVDNIFAAQVGLECVSRQVKQLYFRSALLRDSVFNEWNNNAYKIYDGLTYDVMAFPDCTGYFSASEAYNFQSVIDNAPSSDPAPVLKPSYTDSPLSETAVSDALDNLEAQYVIISKSVEGYWKTQLRNSTIISMCSLVALIIAGSISLMTPFFYTRGVVIDNSGSLERFKQIEKLTKVLAVNSHSIAALKEDPQSHHFLEGTFLVKLIGFIRRARPYIVQTAFGDIENVVLSSTDNGMGGNFVVESNGAQSIHGAQQDYASEDDQRAQELRSEVGLQVAQGTFLCLSRSGVIYDGHDQPKNAENDKKYLNKRAIALSSAIGIFENVANAHHGAVHSITDRYVFLSWNVTSSCPDHELEALTTALEISNALRGVVSGVAMSIASSLVLAGSVEEKDQRAVMICGPALLTCEKLMPLNRYHETQIVMDRSVATKVFSLNIPGYDCCAVPVSLYRSSANGTTHQVAYGLFPSRLTEPLKAWVTLFKEFPQLMESRRLAEMRDIVEEYQRTYVGVGGLPTRSDEAVSLRRTADFWIMLLHRLMSEEERGADVSRV